MMDRLALAAHQHQVLRDRIREQDPDLDEQTLADTLEGLTDLHEIIASIIRFALDDEAQATGLKGRIEDMQARLSRLENRALKRRQIVRDLMIETDIKKIIAPDFTVSTRQGVPALVVIDESLIPPDYWEPRSPRLNRQAILAQLKQGDSIAGTHLSNSEIIISVRVK